MIHLEKLGFLLLISIGALIYAAVRGNPHLRRARDWAHTRLWSFVTLLVVCVATVILIVAVAIYASTDVNFTEHSIVRSINTPIFVKIPLALLCGALFVELAAVVKKPEFTPLYLSVRAVPFVFFFSIGFFSYELQQVLRTLTRVEAAGVTLDFTSSSREQPQSLVSVGNGSNGAGDNIRTPFQLGISMLPEVFNKIASDHSRLQHWCNKHDALSCGNLARARSELIELTEDEQSTGAEVGEAASEVRRARFEAAKKLEQQALSAEQRNEKSFATSKLYLQSLSPLADCLHGTYAAYFPNGSPIQDELSEFAASYSVEPIRFDPSEYKGPPRVDETPHTANADTSAAYGTSTEDEVRKDETRFVPALTTLRENLIRFGNYARQYANIEKYKKLSDAADLCRERLSELDDSVIRQLSKLRLKLEDPKYSLPYKSILEAAIISASGYPEEAAQHLEREYDLFMSEESREHFGIARGDFSEFLLQVRLLSPLEGIFAYTRNTDAQVKYAEILVARVEDQFRKLKAFPTEKPSQFVAHCAAGRLIEPNERIDTEQRNEMEHYFRYFVYFYLQSYLRLLEAAAFDPGVFTKPERFNRFARVAQDLGSLAAEDSSALEGCLGKTLRAQGASQEAVARIIEQLRFDTLAAQGFILARQADQREIDPEIAPHIDQSFKQETTCEAQRILLSAWRIRRVAAPGNGESPDSAYAEKTYKIRRILEQINRSPVDCAA